MPLDNDQDPLATAQDSPLVSTSVGSQELDVKSRPSLSETCPVYNIVLLGPSSSGKSTFLEYVKQYADPSYVPNGDLVGDGNVSHTQSVNTEVVETVLPIYKLHRKNSDEGNEDDHEIDPRCITDERSFKKLLLLDEDLKLLPVKVPGSGMARFRIFDTPGLNDTNENDVKNIARIFPALTAVDQLHLIAIMDPQQVPLTPEQKKAFQTYFDLFKDFKSLITVVHTHTPNHHRFPGINKTFDKKLLERSKFFDSIMGWEAPAVRIDCNLDEKGPAHKCMTFNAIREILEIATIKVPVARNKAHVKKTLVMTNADRKVYKRYQDKLAIALKSCRSKAETVALEIEQTLGEIRAKEQLIREHDTEDLFPLFERRYQEDVGVFGVLQDLFGRASQVQSMNFSEQEFVIDDISVDQSSIKDLCESGGKGETSWGVNFKRQMFWSGCYHVVLSTHKRTKHQSDIKRWRSELDGLNKVLENLKLREGSLKDITERDAVDSSKRCFSDDFEQLRKSVTGYRRIMDVTAAETLPLDMFMELADADIYQGNDSDNQANAVDKYLARKFDVDQSSRNTDFLSSTTSPTLQPAAQPVHTQTQTRTQAQTQTETQRPPTRQRPTLGTPPTWDNLPVFNILLLGPTQSGKSTFIETVKQYADPSYSPNNARIGTGNESHTQEVHVEIITTNLPAYRLYDLEDNLEINITRSLSGMSDRAYKKLLARDDDLTLLPEEVPGSSFVQFRLFDTPGLDDTNGNDIQNIARTFTGLSGVNEFHMVLLIDSHEVPLTISQKAAFQTYFGLFEELKSLITVVHTKFDNFHRHPSSTKLRTKLQGRSQFFNDITGRNLPTKVIDCDLDETGPAHICLTRNTIREILEIATIKTPVTRNRAYVHKALVMGNVDKIVHTKYKAKLDSVNKSCDALGKADKLAIKIAGIEKDIKAIESTVHEYDSDDLFTLYENRFDEEWTFFGWVKDQTMSFPNQQYTIDKMRVARQCMDLLHEAGGEGHKFWDVRFKRESFHSGYFHVVISATLRTKHRKEIEGLRSELDRLRRDLENETREHQKLCAIVQQNTNDSSATLEQLKSKIDKYGKVLDHTSAMRLGLDEFLELANAGIYRGSDVLRSADALENQLAKRFAIDWSWR